MVQPLQCICVFGSHLPTAIPGSCQRTTGSRKQRTYAPTTGTLHLQVDFEGGYTAPAPQRLVLVRGTAAVRSHIRAGGQVQASTKGSLVRQKQKCAREHPKDSAARRSQLLGSKIPKGMGEQRHPAELA